MPLKRLVRVPEQLADSLRPAVDRRSQTDQCRVPLDLWVQLLHQRLEVAAVSVRLRRRGVLGLHVLLRHRRRSISLGPRGRQCQGRHAFAEDAQVLPPILVATSGR